MPVNSLCCSLLFLLSRNIPSRVSFPVGAELQCWGVFCSCPEERADAVLPQHVPARKLRFSSLGHIFPSLVLCPSTSWLRPKHIAQCSKISLTCLVVHCQKLKGVQDSEDFGNLSFPLLSFPVQSRCMEWEMATLRHRVQGREGHRLYTYESSA